MFQAGQGGANKKAEKTEKKAEKKAEKKPEAPKKEKPKEVEEEEMLPNNNLDPKLPLQEAEESQD